MWVLRSRTLPSGFIEPCIRIDVARSRGYRRGPGAPTKNVRINRILRVSQRVVSAALIFLVPAFTRARCSNAPLPADRDALPRHDTPTGFAPGSTPTTTPLFLRTALPSSGTTIWRRDDGRGRRRGRLLRTVSKMKGSHRPPSLPPAPRSHRIVLGLGGGDLAATVCLHFRSMAGSAHRPLR